MKTSKISLWGSLGTMAILSGFALPGCDDDSSPVGNLAEKCGLTCDANLLVKGQAAIGVPGIDGFFTALGEFEAQANLVAGGIASEMAALKAELGLEASATGPEIVAAIKAKYELEGDLSIKVQPAQCNVSAQATVEATAKCSAEVDPGSVKAECSGSCEAEASAEVDCGAEATLKCEGTAPSLECEGTCTGACKLEAQATCEGTCQGECDGTCSVENTDGSCNGKCEGECQGTCQLEAGGSCSGKCEGKCEYTPPSGQCEGSAQAKCEASGSASVECSGKCEGEVTPPSASAECEAQAKASAEVKAECTPPGVDIDYGFSADASAETQAEFRAFLVTFKGHLSAIAAAMGKAEFVVRAGGNLATAAEGAVKASVDQALGGKLDLKTSVGLKCTLEALPLVATVVTDASANLKAQLTASADLMTALGSGG